MTAPKIVLLVLLLARFLQKLPMPSLILFLVINTESLVDQDNLQSSDISTNHVEPSEPSPSPVRLRRSIRSTKGIQPTRYGPIVSHHGECSVMNLEERCKTD